MFFQVTLCGDYKLDPIKSNWQSGYANCNLYYQLHMGGLPKIGGKSPKWMVKIMENPIKIDDLGVPRLFLETSICCLCSCYMLSSVKPTFYQTRTKKTLTYVGMPSTPSYRENHLPSRVLFKEKTKRGQKHKNPDHS